MKLEDYRTRLAPRPHDAHKGDFGHLLIIGGDVGFSGAVGLAAMAAVRVGAGLVTVATRPEHAALMTLQQAEVMTCAVTTASDLQPLLTRVTTIVIGPGLGQSEWARTLLQAVFACQQPRLLDADALNLLSQTDVRQDNWVLTPHPGEAARLLDCDSHAIQQARHQSVLALQQRYGGVVVLKGAGTLVAEGGGKVARCEAGNPGMASAGMGDLLAGVMGGLLAQGLSLTDAACCGVTLHASAGDYAAKQGGERGLLASDLLPYLRPLLNGCQ